MTRQEKLQRLREKVAKTKEALATFPAFFPDYVRLHVQFGEPGVVCRRRKAEHHRGQCAITVQVKEDWLEAVYAKGWAVLNRYFILNVTPLETLPGCEWCGHFTRLSHTEGWKLFRDSRFAVSFGGEIFWSWDHRQAYEHAQQHFTHAITGDEDALDRIPF